MQISLREGVAVADDDTIPLEVAEIGLEGRRVHGHEHIGLVAGGVDTLADAHLVTRHAAERTLRSADFRRIIREGGNLISLLCGNVRENVACKLHAVAGVAGEADHHLVDGFHISLL